MIAPVISFLQAWWPVLYGLLLLYMVFDLWWYGRELSLSFTRPFAAGFRAGTFAVLFVVGFPPLMLWLTTAYGLEGRLRTRIADYVAAGHSAEEARSLAALDEAFGPTWGLRPKDEIEPAPGRAEDYPPIRPPERLPRLSRADLKSFFFTGIVDERSGGDRIQRYEQDEIVFTALGKVRPQRIDSMTPLRALVWRAVPDLPPFREITFLEDIKDKTVESDIYSYVGWKESTTGIEFYSRRSQYSTVLETGCFSLVRLKGSRKAPDDRVPQDYRLKSTEIRTKHFWNEPGTEHCLFRGLLVGLGLHMTPDFYLTAAPLSPAQQARALAALKLLYHPAVQAGMDEESFVQTLLDHDLIDP
ncbi:hypothetical protein [Limibacillus halophilus]|uniref:Uncharacterized protein n=1 Tax=Limibacillus halophilus TaxID=1579333 RepID=A0A839SVB4_9PROT|nr:hypothetical protein [Limibacillus halophilus]MBB3066412.1 hypothetical protein [Limibacillus halophilus]